METALIAIAAVLTALGTTFVVWIYRVDRDLQKMVQDAHRSNYIPSITGDSTTKDLSKSTIAPYPNL